MKRQIYKDEDTKTIYEFIKKKDKEAEEWLAFSSAFKRKMIEGYYTEEELKMCKKLLSEREEK